MPYVMPVFTPMRCRFSRRQRAMLAIITPARFSLFVPRCCGELRRYVLSFSILRLRHAYHADD